jgi:hypothetical protein
MLSDPESSPAPVARQQADGTLALDFGRMPRGQSFDFPDVLRLSSTDSEMARVSISLSGPVADAVQAVGFSNEDGVVRDDLQLAAGASACVAFVLAPDASTPEGPREGTLTIVVMTPDGSTRLWELPLVVIFVSDDVPGDPASPGPAATPVTMSDRVPPFPLS